MRPAARRYPATRGGQDRHRRGACVSASTITLTGSSCPGGPPPFPGGHGAAPAHRAPHAMPEERRRAASGDAAPQATRRGPCGWMPGSTEVSAALASSWALAWRRRRLRLRTLTRRSAAYSRAPARTTAIARSTYIDICPVGICQRYRKTGDTPMRGHSMICDRQRLTSRPPPVTSPYTRPAGPGDRTPAVSEPRVQPGRAFHLGTGGLAAAAQCPVRRHDQPTARDVLREARDLVVAGTGSRHDADPPGRAAPLSLRVLRRPCGDERHRGAGGALQHEDDLRTRWVTLG